MDLSVFLEISNPDENIRRRVVETITSSQGDSSFVIFMINSLLSDEVKNNENLTRSMLIVLVDTARNHSSTVIDALSQPSMDQAMIRLLFSTNFQLRPHVEEVLIVLAVTGDPKFLQMFENIYQHVSPNSQITDIFTAISLSNKWVKKSLNAPFLTNFSQVILPFLKGAVSQHLDEIRIRAVSEIAKLAKALIERGHIVLGGELDEIFQIFCSALTTQLQTQAGLKMKTNVAKLLAKIVYSVFELWKARDDIQDWRNHFSQNILPAIFNASIQASQQPMDAPLSGRLFYLFYLFVSFEIMPQQILTPDFIQHTLIRAARLVGSDLIDYEVNPVQYIAFCCEHENAHYFSPRVCASKFLNIILTKYRQNIDPLPLIAQNSSDPIDFEARIFLLERYTMDCELPQDVFETYFNLLTTEQPLYIVSALIRMITGPMSKNDAVVGITVAEHFIINAEDPIVQFSAVRLMNMCFKDFDENLEALNGIVELKTAEIFPALLNLSNKIHLQEPTDLIKKIFKIGPANYMDIVSELIARFFQLWRENQSMEDDIIVGPSIMDSICTVLESVPANSPLIQSLAPVILQQLAVDMKDFPDNSSLSDQIRVASVFSRKLSTPIQEQITFIKFVITMDISPTDIVDSFVDLICPLMMNTSFDFFSLGFEPYLIQFCDFILEPDSSADIISKCFVLASCLIQKKGEQYFPFVTKASQILMSKPAKSIKKKPTLVYGAVYVFASALFIDPDKSHLLFISEIPDLLCFLLTNNHPASYREIKMSVYVLTCFAKFGHSKSYEVAASLFKQLFDMKALDEIIESTPDTLIEKANLYRAEQLISLSPLIVMPFDDFDELTFFMDFSSQSGFVSSIPGGLQGLLSSIQ